MKVLNNKNTSLINFTLDYENNSDIQDNIVDVVDLSERWYEEYNNCNLFNIIIEINTFFTNVLCNITGDKSYETITELRNFISDENRYEFEVDDILFEKNGYHYYYNNSNNKIYLKPNKDNLNINLFKIFLFEHEEYDENYRLYNNKPIKFGIPIINWSYVEYNGKLCTQIYCLFKHNLNINDEISITANDIQNVYLLGDINNEYNEYALLIDRQINLSDGFYLKKRFQGVDKKYFLNKIKKITNLIESNFNLINDSNTIYFDEKYNSFFLNKNINFDNQYIGLLKSNDDFFGNSFYGIKTIDNNSSIDINLVNEDNYSFNEELSVSSDYYLEGIYEYDDFNNEYIKISDIYIRFNSKNRIENNYNEGYWYKPFYNIITKSDTTEIFLNNRYELYQAINLFLKRQNPCNLYDLGGNINPINGKCIEIENTSISTDKIC